MRFETVQPVFVPLFSNIYLQICSHFRFAVTVISNLHKPVIWWGRNDRTKSLKVVTIFLNHHNSFSLPMY